MDADERLSPAQTEERTLLAAHHLHRYEIAGRLCEGLRVLDLGCGVGYGSAIMRRAGAAAVSGIDVDPEAIEEAERHYGADGCAFAVGDALETVDRADPGEFDAIVAFEVLEHVLHPDALVASLATHASRGTRVIASVPNSRAFGERNEFHVTDFDFDSATALFTRLGEHTILYQHLAEGSIVMPAPGPLAGLAGALEHGEPEYANTFIAAVGFEAETLAHATAHLNVVATPNHNRFMLELQRGNEELRRVNKRLARRWLGRSDAAAAALIARLEARAEIAERLQREADERTRHVLSRVDELTAECLRVGDDRASALADAQRLRAELARLYEKRGIRAVLKATKLSSRLPRRGS